MIVKEVSARKIKDSRGEHTIEVYVNGTSASSPSGKSTGKYESKQYMKNLDWNIDFLNNWNDEIEIEKFEDLAKIEEAVCKRLRIKDVKEFGANALFAFESAILKALAEDKGKELWQVINPNAKRLPLPMGNVIGGGVHSSNASKPEIQEFLIMPQARKFSDNVKAMKSVYEKCGNVTGSKEKNDEGAWQTDKSNEEVIDLISKIASDVGKKMKMEIKIGVDVAASEIYKNKKYNYRNWKLDKIKQIKYAGALVVNHGVFSIEDPLDQEDFEGFRKLRLLLKNGLVVGDDLTATQIERVKKAIKLKAVNAVIIKPNQNGSLLELAEIVEICKKNKIKTILSHRSGETLDSSLADYAFAFQTDYIKCGIATKWRESKLDRLIEIEKSF